MSKISAGGKAAPRMSMKWGSFYLLIPNIGGAKEIVFLL
jgi:hypothetical protein